MLSIDWNHYKKDINSINPLGFGGRLAEAFAEFMKKVWSCMHRMTEPAAIKELVAEKASQFANFAQHDAHEFMSFLIDGLHEDLNRIRSKPNTNTIEPRGRPDYEVSKEAWSNYLMRNDSIFVDLFHGQLKSRLQCPRCNQISITFDPFVYLAVPFPKEKRSLWIYFWPLDPFLKPVKLNIRVSADANVSEVLSSVSHLVNVLTKSLRMIEVSNHRISKIFRADDSASQILPTDVIYVFQVHDPLDCNEEVVELFVIQRLLYHKSIVRACANCHTTETSLKVCDGCYDSFYCKRECQRQHWISEHKDRCKLRSHVEYVGEPFIISLPKSKVTYANIIRNLESRCRYSVNVFQPPIETKDPPDSPSSSAIASSETCSTLSSTVNGVRHPMVQKSARPIGVKRQMVLGEPRNKQFYDSHLFLVRKLQSAENVLGPIIAATDDELTIQSSTVLSINWMNMKNGKDYLTVESKEEVDVDEDKTAYYQRISATSTNRNASTSNPSLYDMLSMFSETERLKPEESWYCNKCKEHVEATKQLMLYRLPPILIIQLKSLQKISKSFKSIKETLYDLTGVVCHSGSSYFGHYVSMGRLQSLDGKMTEIDWRLFDDSVVTRIQPSRVQSADAYLLFYKQRGSNTERVLKRNYNLDLVNVPSSSHSN
ncbi:unnamed protein product [Dracunculus medinensis]|uniref:ubiquitinyl hydrolase 1 n=1 Tax=Dracunculus medinensis TaxID=318479 RepID=A0A0N4UBQ0_DRAME|nr:unnamed protein product [Dracunculus medinensis]